MRKEGRAQGSWRRAVEETKLAGKTGNGLSWPAQDCVGWRRLVGALCSSESVGEDG